MRVQHHFFLITYALLLTCGFGCAGPNTMPSTSPAFFEEEIRSLQWRDPKGEAIALISWDNVKTKTGDNLVIAKYGETNVGAIKCLDFFRVIPKEYPRERATFVLLYRDWGPREGNWRDTEVVSLNLEEEPKRVYFRIVRKILTSPENRKNEGVMYSLHYNVAGDYRMTLNGEEFLFNLSSQAK